MTVPIAHVGGVPVEELVPLAVAWLAAAGASVRHMIAARHRRVAALPSIDPRTSHDRDGSRHDCHASA